MNSPAKSLYKKAVYNQGTMKNQIEEYLSAVFGDTTRILPDRSTNFDFSLIKAPGGWQRETKTNFSSL
jgi:hypothetical protein